MFSKLLARLSRSAVDYIKRWKLREVEALVETEAVAVLAYCAANGRHAHREDWNDSQFYFWMAITLNDLFAYEHVFCEFLKEA